MTEPKYPFIAINENTFMSGDITELSEALSKFQGEVKNPQKNKKNPHCNSKYADFPEVLEVCKEPLTKNGLAVTQHIGQVIQMNADKQKSEIPVTTILLHKSGQYIGSTCSMVVKPFQAKGGGYLPEDTQADASATTYIRRYSYMAILGIAGDEDDDGNSASGNGNSEKPQEKVTSGKEGENKISEGQRKRLWAISNANQDLISSVLKEFGYSSSKDILLKHYEQICNIVESKAGKRE